MGRSSNPEVRAAGGGPHLGLRTSVEGCVTEAEPEAWRAEAARASWECCSVGTEAGALKSPGRYGGGIIPQEPLLLPHLPF